VSAPEDNGAALVFATVGTDHHRFDRLVDWIDGWIVDHGDEHVSALVQTGTSRRPRHAQGADYLGYDEMQANMRRAAAIVSHGGPGSIMLACYCGKKPIVVPRTSALGEHVDQHQVLFARRLAAEGEILLAENEDEFDRLLEDVLGGTAPVRSTNGSDRVARSVHRFELLLGDLMSAHG
jgi:UDP-N-acetylglucosamine transferase subunit ALG13